MELLAAPVNPEEAARMVPEPAVGEIERSVHVATPATAFLVSDDAEARFAHVAVPDGARLMLLVASLHRASPESRI